ncbi:hypothetical protein N7470_009624 [Penicillium chermesinum]|nr:hypothetical protein N7470_009624 [Penicillium chermesinum]
MEAKAAELLAAFKNPNVSIDARVAHLTSIKSDIKQKNVPEGAIMTIFETLKLAISSQHYSVCAAGFSTLGHFLKRLMIQEQQQWILAQTRNFYPVLMEKLGDHKERVRALSASIFTELWPLVGNEVEYFVLEVGMMTKNHGLLFRQYVPSLVGCLEDADSAVRDTARGVVVDLFRYATNPDPSPSIGIDSQSLIQECTRTCQIGLTEATGRSWREKIDRNCHSLRIGLAEPDTASSARPISRAERPLSVMSSRSRAPIDVDDDEPEAPVSRPGSSRSHHERPVASSSSEAPARPKTPAELPPAGTGTPEDDGLEPFLVSSSRDIDDLVRDMLPWFDGKESEDNWMKREKNVILFRRLTRGNAPHDFSQAYIHAAKSLLDGFFKVVNSLRTTMSTNGCLLIQDMARICGPRIDPMVEIMMQNLLKLCSALKKISAQNGNITVDTVIANVSYNIRLLQHDGSEH